MFFKKYLVTVSTLGEGRKVVDVHTVRALTSVNAVLKVSKKYEATEHCFTVERI